MRGRLKVFSVRLFTSTHVSLAYIASALSSFWEIELYAREAIPPRDIPTSLHPIPMTSNMKFQELVKRGDVVHFLLDINALDMFETIREICTSTGIPYVISLGGTEIYEWLQRNNSSDEIERLMIDSCQVIVPTNSQRNLILNQGLPPNKITTIKPGLPLEPYNSITAYERQDIFTVCFIGRLKPRKNVVAAFKAFQIMHSSCPNSRFVIVGDGPDRESLIRVIQESGLEKSYAFLGRLPHSQMLEVLRAASVLCCPAIVDARAETSGLPFVVLESQAIGVPVVATNVGGMGEGVKDGETGFLASSSDPQELAHYLLILARKPLLRLRMAIAARKWVQDYFDLKSTIKSLDGIYRAAIQGSHTAF